MVTVNQPETHDEVIVEIRRIKELLAAQCNYDVAKILLKAREQQELDEQSSAAAPK